MGLPAFCPGASCCFSPHRGREPVGTLGFCYTATPLTTSCRREPSSQPLRHGPPRTSTTCFPTRLPWTRAFWSPDARFLWPSRVSGGFLRRRSLQETRTHLAGTIRLPGYTAISTDAGPEAFYGVQLWFRTPASDRGAHDRTASRHESHVVLLEDLRILAVSATSIAGQKLLMVTFHAPHAQRPHTEIHAWWTRFDELVAAWNLQFSDIVLLGDTNGRVVERWAKDGWLGTPPYFIAHTDALRHHHSTSASFLSFFLCVMFSRVF